MKIGIIGAGMIGGTLGTLWLRAGHEVRFATRHPARVQVPGATAGDKAAVADWAEVLVIAVPLGQTPAVAASCGPSSDGKIVIDTGNPYPAREPEAAAEVAAGGAGSGIWVARHFPRSKVVKAFNTVFYKTLRDRAGKDGAPGIPIAGDDKAALAIVAGLVRDAGFEAVIAGSLANARLFDPGTPLWNSSAAPGVWRKALPAD